ncbi:MAG: hypothetical protein AAGF73_08805 [Actinomycetota bacterium]
MRILIVAHQTIGGAALEQAIADRMAAGAAEFHLVVPVRGGEVDPSLATMVVPGFEDDGMPPEQSMAPSARVQAAQRVAFGIEWLERLGADATGEVGPADDVDAVLEAIARHPADEIIVSTLERNLSRWLRLDLPSRLGRKVDVPVAVVSASGSDN